MEWKEIKQFHGISKTSKTMADKFYINEKETPQVSDRNYNLVNYQCLPHSEAPKSLRSAGCWLSTTNNPPESKILPANQTFLYCNILKKKQGVELKKEKLKTHWNKTFDDEYKGACTTVVKNCTE